MKRMLTLLVVGISLFSPVMAKAFDKAVTDIQVADDKHKPMLECTFVGTKDVPSESTSKANPENSSGREVAQNNAI